MRLEQLFRNLGVAAGTVASNLRNAATPGVPLTELDPGALPPPHSITLSGASRVVVSDGQSFDIAVDGDDSTDVRFAWHDGRLNISGGQQFTTVRIVAPAPRTLMVAGSGSLQCAQVAADGELFVAGTGRLEVAQVRGGDLSVHMAGSGRLTLDGRAESLSLSIAGSGSCDGEGLVVETATVNVAGSGDAIFACDGEVTANLLGSGNVIVRGSARCQVHAVGSGTLVCERSTAPA